MILKYHSDNSDFLVVSVNELQSFLVNGSVGMQFIKFLGIFLIICNLFDTLSPSFLARVFTHSILVFCFDDVW